MKEERCLLLCLDLPRAERVRDRLPAPVTVAAAAAAAQALADPTRLRIAWALAEGGELCVCDLAWVTGLAQNLVSHHVRRLKQTGLALSRRDGRLVMYRLTAHGCRLLAALRDPSHAPGSEAKGDSGRLGHEASTPSVEAT